MSESTADTISPSDPVREYLSHPQPGELNVNKPIWIPTGNNDGNWFIKTNDAWTTNRTKELYDTYLFGDEFSFIDPRPSNLPMGIPTPTLRHPDEQRTIEGWSREDFFKAGRVVVELGSGEAFALLQYSIEFPNTTFVGVDQGYRRSKRINFNKKGVQLIKDDWTKMNLFPNNSVDTLISVQGGLTWTVEKDKHERSGNPVSFIRTLTRIAKSGCIFLTDSLYPVEVDSDELLHNEPPEYGKEFIALFHQYGWERITLNKSAFFVLTEKRSSLVDKFRRRK